MAKKPAALKSVEALKHDEAKRKNIPTAEFQFVLEKEQQDPKKSAIAAILILIPSSRGPARTHWRAIATPQGNAPTAIDLSTLRLPTSMTETSFETPLVV
jgi:hypothetical protein